MKQKKFEATIGLVDRHTGTERKKINFYATDNKEAEIIARKKGTMMAFQYSPDTFFVEDVHEV